MDKIGCCIYTRPGCFLDKIGHGCFHVRGKEVLLHRAQPAKTHFFGVDPSDAPSSYFFLYSTSTRHACMWEREAYMIFFFVGL